MGAGRTGLRPDTLGRWQEGECTPRAALSVEGDYLGWATYCSSIQSRAPAPLQHL